MSSYKTLPRVDHGVDHGTERILIAEGNGRRVWWTKGHTAWASAGERKYYPGELTFAAAGDHIGRAVARGGRMSTRVAEMRHQIDAFIAEGADQ